MFPRDPLNNTEKQYLISFVFEFLFSIQQYKMIKVSKLVILIQQNSCSLTLDCDDVDDCRDSREIITYLLNSFRRPIKFEIYFANC